MIKLISPPRLHANRKEAMAKNQSSTTTTVFYDGMCPVCSREVRQYQALEVKGRIRWLDLRKIHHDIELHGFTFHDAMQLLHVKDTQGRLHIGIAAHIAMWSQLPYFRALAWLLQRIPWLTYVLEKIYIFLTRHRPGLKRTQPPTENS
jgi:predicted DCC family thiol-disulfide oxidoreductase YuxK